MDLLDVEIAVLVFLELDPETVELLDDVKAARRVFVDRRLIADAVIGDGDFLGVLLGRGVAGNDGIVQPVHAHRDRARTLDVGLFQKNHASGRVTALGLVRRHRSGGSAADHEDIAGDFGQTVLDLIHIATSMLSGEFAQIGPGIDAAIVPVRKRQAQGVIPDRFDRGHMKPRSDHEFNPVDLPANLAGRTTCPAQRLRFEQPGSAVRPGQRQRC